MFQKDKELEKIRNKDPEAFERLYKEYRIVIYNYLLIKTKGNTDVSKDILSETFCSLMENSKKIKNLINMKGYLLQIANRRLSDFLRKNYHDENYNKYFDINDRLDDNMMEVLNTKEQLLLVNMAMANLKPLFKNVLKLKYIEEKSQNEIANIIDKSVSAVEALLVRARKQLRLELKKIKGFDNEF